MTQSSHTNQNQSDFQMYTFICSSVILSSQDIILSSQWQNPPWEETSVRVNTCASDWELKTLKPPKEKQLLHNTRLLYKTTWWIKYLPEHCSPNPSSFLSSPPPPLKAFSSRLKPSEVCGFMSSMVTTMVWGSFQTLKGSSASRRGAHVTWIQQQPWCHQGWRWHGWLAWWNEWGSHPELPQERCGSGQRCWRLLWSAFHSDNKTSHKICPLKCIYTTETKILLWCPKYSGGSPLFIPKSSDSKSRKGNTL